MIAHTMYTRNQILCVESVIAIARKLMKSSIDLCIPSYIRNEYAAIQLCKICRSFPLPNFARL